MKTFSMFVFGITLYFLIAIFDPAFGQTGFVFNPDYNVYGSVKKVTYTGSLDTLGEANDTLYGSPVSVFNRYPGYTWIIKYKFTSVGDCTTSIFMQRSDIVNSGFTTVATDTVRDKGVTVDAFTRYHYPVFSNFDFREYYRFVVVNEEGGRDSTAFEIVFEGYPPIE